MRASPACYALIKASESLRLRAYHCPSGVPTIGWGHIRGVTHEHVRRGRTISVTAAEALLVDDVEYCEQAVSQLVRVPLTQGQYDALCDFVFNFGEHALRHSTLLRLLNAGDYRGAADQLPRWVKGRDPGTGRKVTMGGLVKRRAAERRLFLGHDDTTNPGQ
jgi:lysozyme